MQALLELVAYLITTKSWGIRASLEDTPETTQLRNEEETRQPDNPYDLEYLCSVRQQSN